MNRFLMKLFQTTDMNIVKDYQEYLSVSILSSLIIKQTEKFLAKLNKPWLIAALSNRTMLYRDPLLMDILLCLIVVINVWTRYRRYD